MTQPGLVSTLQSDTHIKPAAHCEGSVPQTQRGTPKGPPQVHDWLPWQVHVELTCDVSQMLLQAGATAGHEPEQDTVHE